MICMYLVSQDAPSWPSRRLHRGLVEAHQVPRAAAAIGTAKMMQYHMYIYIYIYIT